MNSFSSIKDLGTVIQADISYSVGLFNLSQKDLIIRLIEMFIIYFNSVLQVAINKRLNRSLEFRGILASFIIGILLLFPSVRVAFTSYLQSRSGVELPWFVSLIYNFTGTYIYSKFSNFFKFAKPNVDANFLLLSFLYALKAYAGDKQLVNNFILGGRHLQDTLMLVDVLIEILLDKGFSWQAPEDLFSILVDSPLFLFTQLGLKTQTVTGSMSQSNLGIYAMTFFEGIIFYKSDVSSELYLFLFCIVFQVQSTVFIKLAYVMRCLSPWDARIKPNHTWDIYWRSLVSYCLLEVYDFTSVGHSPVTIRNNLDEIITKAIIKSDWPVDLNVTVS